MRIVLNKKILQVLIHIISWIVFLSLLSFLVPGPQKINRLVANILPYIFFISFFYLSYFILVPRLFIEKKYILFFLVCAISLLLTIVIPSLINEIFRPAPLFPANNPVFPPGFPGHANTGPMMPGPVQPHRIRFFRPEFSFTVLVFLLILTLSLGIRIIVQWQQTEKEKINAELAFLKAQINPHFLFNTLNNIYSMAVSKNEETPHAIELFSEMMRFVILETTNDYVPLRRKIEYIESYIQLQKMRLSSSVKVHYIKKGDPGSLMIAPLILTPFIENAFKYGVSTEKESSINIGVEIENSDLTLIVKNSKVRTVKEDNNSQVGLGNTIKRIKLAYPGRHVLDIDDGVNYFYVRIKLNLK